MKLKIIHLKIGDTTMNQYIIKVEKNGKVTEHQFSSVSSSLKGAKEDAELWLKISNQKCNIKSIKRA